MSTGNNRTIGTIIREFRQKQGMTGGTLALKAGLSQSKVSKIETGRYPRLQRQDIEQILNILKASSTIRQQVLGLLDDTSTGRNDMLLYPFLFGADYTKYERQSKLIRIYCPTAAPALLQVMEYREAFLKYLGLQGSELQEHLQRTLVRQDIIWDGKHRLHVIMPEAALYTRVSSRRTLLAQLDRLERVMQTPAVRIGIIPLEAGLALAESGAFTLYDERTVAQGLANGELFLSEQKDIDVYLGIFGALDQLAYYDNDARALIRKAMDHFA